MYDLSGKTIIPFCSMGGGRFGQTISAVAKLAPESTIRKGLDVMYTSYDRDRIADWLNENGITKSDEDSDNYNITLTAGDTVINAVLYKNATTDEIVSRLPLTLPMMDLYGREMCYRFPDALPTDDVNYTDSEKGEITYWPPGHSFVIIYKTTDEIFEQQKLGYIEDGVGFFGNGDIDVTVELAQ